MAVNNNKLIDINISDVSEEDGVVPRLTLVIPAEEVSQSVVVVTPSPVRKESISRSVPSLAGRSVAVDGAGLVGLVLVVLGRRPHHVALIGLERFELLAALHGNVHPGSPGRATGSGATDGEVITERDVLINALAVLGLISREEDAVPGEGPDPGAVLDTG